MSLVSACTAAGARKVATPPQHIALPEQLITGRDIRKVAELFARAQRELAAEQYAAAAADFEKVIELDAQGVYAASAWFGAGTAWDLLGKNPEACHAYEQLVRHFPNDEHARVALIRSVRLNTYLEQWARAAALADEALAHYTDLSVFEFVAVMSAKALERTAQGNDQSASLFVEKARTVVENAGLDAAGKIPRDLAQLYYALGEVRRLQAERIRFMPLPPNFAAVLEQRCQLLLDAQGAYSDAMRAYDAHWSSMAGFRVGELYQKLHEDVMQIPTPKAADNAERRALFDGAMKLRYSVLLDKALAMLDHTLAMAKRVGEETEWVTRVTALRARILETQNEQKRALSALPYSREELQKALDLLAKKSSAKAKVGSNAPAL